MATAVAARARVFDFGDCLPDTFPRLLKRPKPKRAAKAKPAPTPAPPPAPLAPAEDVATLGDMCVLLHSLAAQYVPRSDVRATLTVVDCAKLLDRLGLQVQLPTDMLAQAADRPATLVQHDPQYRFLRASAIAGFSTLVEIAERPATKGSPDYQRGQRDARQQISVAALSFLETVNQDLRR